MGQVGVIAWMDVVGGCHWVDEWGRRVSLIGWMGQVGVIGQMDRQVSIIG